MSRYTSGTMSKKNRSYEIPFFPHRYAVEIGSVRQGAHAMDAARIIDLAK